MKYLIILVLLGSLKFSYGQNDSSIFYIKKISWNSFVITTNYVSILSLKDEAKKLITLEGKGKVKKLIQCLNDKNKVVAAHVILTQMVEPDSSKFSQLYNYGKDSTVIGVQYSYNKLSWNWSENFGNKINKSDMLAIKRYWKRKL
jgi:hypothetical protein